jgi:non-ribosomal peptide synthetase component F
VTWVEVFIVLVLSHLSGDFLLQTEWQATHKYGGLARDAVARRALVMHVTTYGLACVPALAWLWAQQGLGAAAAVAAMVIGLHLVQDDGRALRGYIRLVKHSDAGPGDSVFMLADQSLHMLVLFGAALVAVA